MKQEAYTEMYCVEDEHWWFVTRRMIIKRILDTLLNYSITPDILEVGCGTGGNLELLSSYGVIHAIEVDDVARDLANKRNICSVKPGSLPKDIPFTKAFNLICMLDVLEHIDDDLAAIKAIAGKLKKNGKILITVPAYMFMWSSHDVALHHKRRYTKKQLTGVVQSAGLEIIYSTYFNTYLFPLIVLVRILKNLFGKKDGTDVTMPSKLMNNLLKKIFYSERLFIPRMSLPFGISILMMAEKRN